MGTKGVVVGQVVEIRPHPRGDRIWLAEVNIGTDCTLQIVMGGVQVLQKGDLVPVAKPGAWLPAMTSRPHPYKIRHRRYRGVISEGMLCSLAELGWDPSVTDRIAILEDSAGLRPGDSLDNIDNIDEIVTLPNSESFPQ